MSKKNILLFICIYFLSFLNVYAEVISDNTTGSNVIQQDSNYLISSDNVKQGDINIFHSFSVFNLNKDESAIFSGPDSVLNIINRVTGPGNSFIDGTIKSEIKNANLYLLNPYGVIFGPNSSLDITGSFYVSTADKLIMEDEEFSAKHSIGEAFPMKNPTGFSFSIDNGFEAVHLNSAKNIKIENGNTISFIGGDKAVSESISNLQSEEPGVKIINSQIKAEESTINIASVASAGEVLITDKGLDTSSIKNLGNITIYDKSSMNASGETGGNVNIYGNYFVCSNSEIKTNAINDAGNINIFANKIDIINSGHFDSITAKSSYGKSGDISLIAADSIILKDASILTNAEKNSGDAGKVTLSSLNINISESSSIAASTSGSGNGGDIHINAKENLILSSGSSIHSKAWEKSTGNAGNIYINAKNVINNEGVLITASTDSSSIAGNIEINSEFLSLNKGSIISSETNNLLNGNNAGNIIINNDKTICLNNSQISTSSNGKGNAGNVVINTENLVLNDKSSISSESRIDGNVGDAGFVSINASGNTNISNDSEITTKSLNAGGGSIDILSSDLFIENSNISTIVEKGNNNGGNIFIKSSLMTIKNGKILANANSGAGGNISISSDLLIKTYDSIISASSNSGIYGIIDIDATNPDIGLQQAPLATNFLLSNIIMLDPCSARFESGASTFSFDGLESVPASFNDWMINLPEKLPDN